jgi:hypothetical protein
VFTWPLDKPREADLVAVMMPFASAFDPVYDTIKAACAEAGLRAVRADDMWDADHIIDDVIRPIWRARVVVSDFTGTNANVFYETGLAHSLGRDTIQITQNFADVPFDLRSIRTLTTTTTPKAATNCGPRSPPACETSPAADRSPAAQQIDSTYEWMRAARTIVVDGAIQRDPGKPLRIDAPVGSYPLDETFLPGGNHP